METTELLEIVESTYKHVKRAVDDLDTIELERGTHEEELHHTLVYLLDQGRESLLDWVNSLEDKLDPDNQHPKPWFRDVEPGTSETDAEYDALWKACTAQEFYFRISHEDEEIWITPVSYYAEEGCLLDTSVRINHLLDKRWNETQDSMFEFYGTFTEARDFLLKAGFVEKTDMTP